MRTFLRVLASFILGLIVTYVVVVIGLFAYAGANHVVDRNGGMAMGIVFMVGPAAGLLGGVIAAIAVPIWLGRRDRARQAGTLPPAKRWPLPLRMALAAILSGGLIYAAGRIVLWLNEGPSFASYWTALAVSLSPIVLGLAAAALAALAVGRSARRQAS